MRKLFYSLCLITLLGSNFALTSCREKHTVADDVEDAIDDAGDAIEDAVDD